MSLPLTSLFLPRTHCPSRLSSCLARTAPHVSACTLHRAVHFIVRLAAGDKQGTGCDDCQTCCCSLEPRANRQGRVRQRHRPRAGVGFAQGCPSSLVLLHAPLPPPSMVLAWLRCMDVVLKGVLDGVLDGEHRCRAPNLLRHPGPGRPSSLAHSLPAPLRAPLNGWCGPIASTQDSKHRCRASSVRSCSRLSSHTIE